MRRLSALLPAALDRSYAAKFTLVLVLVTGLLSGLGGYIYVHSGQVIAEDTQDEMVANAEIQARTLDEWLSRMDVQMDAISESAAFQAGNRTEIDLYLWNVVQRDDDVDAAYYIDTASGTVITSAGSANVVSATTVTKAYGQKRFAAIAQETDGDVTVSEPFRPSPDSAPVLLFTTRIPDRPNRAVVMVTDLASFSESNLHHSPNGRFVVVDGEGTVVMAKDDSAILTTDRIDPGRLRYQSGFLTTTGTADDHTAEVGYAALDTHDWVVTSRVPTPDAYALRADILEQLLLVVLAVVAGAALIGVTIGRDTVNEVHTLAEKARALRDGDLDVTVDTDRTDEFGDLFEAFDVMRCSLRDQIRAAEQARREALDAKAETQRFSDHLEATAADYGAVMQACADGDLTRRIDPDDRSEAMATIARSFNEMMADVQRQNEHLETVSHVLSHDLRNPLNVAAGRAQLLADADADADASHVDPLVTALDRIDAIVDDALALTLRSRVDETRPVDLAAAADTSWGHVQTHDATLELGESHRFEADPGLLEHVFENLFRNAVEHGGHDVVVRVGALADGFYVEDDGPGIPEARRSEVFDPGVTTNRANGGTGFGLAIVARIVDQHGWSLAVTTATDGGARFEVTDVSDPHDDAGGTESLV